MIEQRILREVLIAAGRRVLWFCAWVVFIILCGICAFNVLLMGGFGS